MTNIRAGLLVTCSFLFLFLAKFDRVEATQQRQPGSTQMFAIIGLGNPGNEYAKNRHNAGFMLVDLLHESYGTSPWRRKFQGELAEATIADHKVLLFKPQTYMNLSGHAVGQLVNFYKLSPENIIIAYDELDVALGDLKVRNSGGAGGHNGIKSLLGVLPSNFVRLRLGIGHPGDRNKVSNYVLSDFPKSEGLIFQEVIEEAERNMPLLLEGKNSQFIERIKNVLKEE